MAGLHSEEAIRSSTTKTSEAPCEHATTCAPETFTEHSEETHGADMTDAATEERIVLSTEAAECRPTRSSEEFLAEECGRHSTEGEPEDSRQSPQSLCAPSAHETSESCRESREEEEAGARSIRAVSGSSANDFVASTSSSTSRVSGVPRASGVSAGPGEVSISICSCGHHLSETARFCGKCGKSRRESILEAAKSQQLFTKRSTITIETPVAPAMNSTVTAAKQKSSSDSTSDQLKSWQVHVDRSSGQKLGMSINRTKLRIERISAGGLIDCWNERHPDLKLEPGMKIIEVNGFTTAADIFNSCTQDESLDITVQGDDRDSRNKIKVVDPAILDSKEKTVEVNEMQTLAIGPFPAGVACEFIDATYGWQEKQVNVLEKVRAQWAKDHLTGMRLSYFNKQFGVDPAPLKIKKLRLTYRLHNVKEWDVSHSKYTEGIGRVGLAVPILAKALSNVVGLGLAGSGYLLGAAETSIRSRIRSVSGATEETIDPSIADSSVFKFGFMSWLNCNGIFPTVNYQETGNKGKRLRMEQFPQEIPPVPAPKEDMKQTALIVANHVCYIDGFVLAACFNGPKVIAMAGTKNTPIVGPFADAIGVIEVDRQSKDSRAATLEAIQTHVREWKPGHRPMLLFPEGTTSNGEDLLGFKKGAFISGVPVRPVVMYYTGNWHPANTNYKMNATGEIEPTGDADWYNEFLGHMIHSLRVEVLPPYIPKDDEKANPELYASQVRDLMRQAYLDLKGECDRERAKSEAEGWTGMARRAFIDKPVDIAAMGWKNTFGKFLGESDDESSYNRSHAALDRRRSASHHDRRTSRRSRKSERHRTGTMG